ncbi:hypothetical protein diail_8938 [Diaporthe ilicicola]|nr:hypothetical protein diail_8938 [Diaporthe ilicicola]
MFSPSAWGGSTCLRCQIRAVTRRAPPLFAAAQIRGRQRRCASNSTKSWPADVDSAEEVREQRRENDYGLDRSRPPQPDESSASGADEQNLSDRSQGALSNPVNPHDGSGLIRDRILSGIDRDVEQDHEVREGFDLESAHKSESGFKTQDRRDAGNANHEEASSLGQTHQDFFYKTSTVAKRTCPHCQKHFGSQTQRDKHLRRGCAKPKPPRHLKCPKCGDVFGTKQLLRRHRSKGLCPAEVEPDQLIANKEGQKIEDILSQAAAEFSRHSATSRTESNIADDWSPLQRREAVEPTRHAAAIDEKLEKHGTMVMDANIQENPSGVLNNRYHKGAEGDSDNTQMRTSVRNTRGRQREHRRGNMMLVEDASKLSVDTLGKAAEVIVLRDKRQLERKASPFEVGSGDAVGTGLNIEDFLDEQESLNPDNVIENIHGLKPKRHIVSEREFMSLFKTLLNGFTTIQLEKYVWWHREQPILEMIKDEVFGEDETSSKEPRIPEDVLDKKREYAWMIEQAHWAPHVDGALKEARYPLTGYVMKSMTPKQRLVIQLVRECWDVSIQELLDGNGSVDIRVRDLEFKLLTLGTQRWFQTIARVILKEGQQIEVERSNNLIRISAPKSVAETCMHALDETLQKIKTKSFKVDQVPMQRLDAGILKELGRITNSVVEFGRLKEVIQITWIDIRDEESQSVLEDSADVVFRLLLTAHVSARTSNNITVYPDIEDKGRVVEDYSNKEKLSWMDRRKEWARLCLPLTKNQSRAAISWPPTTEILQFKAEPAEEDLVLPNSTLQPKLHAVQNARPIGIPRSEKEDLEQPKEQHSEQESKSKAVEVTPSGWRPFKITTTAAFGHILHLNKPELAQNIARPNVSTSLASWPRTFAPLIPPIAQMELPGWVPYDETKNQESTILMRFVPYSENAEYSDSSAFFNSTAPTLELRLTATDRTVVSAKSLRAMNRISISDILLPAEHVDVRTTQREYAELPAASIDSTEGMEPLLEFLQNSRLELSRGRLVTPPRLHNLGLPRWLMAPPPGTATGAAAAARRHLPHTPEGNKLRRTSYVFAGLEVHRARETTYNGWKLVYTSIQAGQGGGQRAELSLEAVPGYDTDLRRTKEAMNTAFFLRSLYQLARGEKGHVVRRASDEEDSRTTISWVR